MASTFSTNLKIELMATGENSGTWGTVTNTNLGTALEQAIVGYGNPSYSSDANLTISLTDSNAAQAARALVLNVTSSVSLTATRELVVPTIQKQYIVQNNTTGSQSITVKTSAGTGITVPSGRKAHLYVDGTNVIFMDDYVDINGGTIDNVTIGGSTPAAGNFTTVDTTNLEVTNIKAKDGTAAASIADSTGVVTVTAAPVMSALTASQAVFTTAGKALTSNPITGTGNVVMSASPTLTGTVAAAAVTLSSDLTLSGGTANGVLYLNGSKVATSGSALTFDGTNLGLSGLGSRFINLGSTSTNGQSAALQISAPNSDASANVYRVGTGLTADNEWVVYDVTNTQVVDKYIRGSSGFRAFYQNGSEQMRLTSTGLGIGTSSPGARLHVNVESASETDVARFQASNGGDVQFLDIGADATNNLVSFDVTGSSSGSYVFRSGGTERMRLDSSGNLGLGATPSAWSSPFKAFEGGDSDNQEYMAFQTNANAMKLGVNHFYLGSNYVYKFTGAASRYDINDTSFIWNLATSGAGNTTTITNGVSYTIITSGNQTSFGAANNNVGTAFTATSSGTLSSGTVSQNISFTQAMTLDASSRLMVGVTSNINPSTVIQAGGISNARIGIDSPDSQGIYFTKSGANNGTYRVDTNGNFEWYTKNVSQAMTLDASGNLGVGNTSPTVRLHVEGATNVTSRALFNNTANSRTAAIGGNRDTSDCPFVGATTNHAFAFITNDTERARITSGGDFLVAKTSASATTVGVQLEATGGSAFTRSSSSNSDLNLYVYSTGAGAARFYVGMGGTVYATNTTISAISDQRLKENIQDIDVGLDKIMALKPRKFDWKAGKGKDIKDDRGFIAQEFEQVFPDLVDQWADPAPEGEEPYKAVRADLIPVLVKAIQEQQTIIQSLTARIAALESKGV